MTQPDIIGPGELAATPFVEEVELQETDEFPMELDEMGLDEEDDENQPLTELNPAKRPDKTYLVRRKLNSELPDGYSFDEDSTRGLGVNARHRISQGIFGGRRDNSHVDFAEEEAVSELSRMVRQFPLLNRKLEQIIFTHRDNGGTISDLRRDPKFWEAFDKAEPEQIQLLLDSSSSIRDLVVNANMRLVFKVANRYKGALPMSDMVAEGAIGMQRAVDKFEVEKGFKFSTYATWWIRQAISRAVIDLGSTIRIPVHAAETVNGLRNLIEDFTKREGRNPEFHELLAVAANNGYEKTSVINIVQAALQGTVGEPTSLDTPVGDDEEATIGDFIGDTEPEANMISSAFNLEDREAINAALESLTARERRVIELRFGLEGNSRTLEEVGREFGVTRERIRQMEAKALVKLRANRKLRRQTRVSDEVDKAATRSIPTQRHLQAGKEVQIGSLESVPVKPKQKEVRHEPTAPRVESVVPEAPNVKPEVPQKSTLSLLDDDDDAGGMSSIYEKVESFYDNNEFLGYDK